MSLIFRFGLAILAAVSFLTPLVSGEEEPVQKEEQERLRAKALVLELLSNDAIIRADAVGKTNPMQAVEILNQAMDRINADKEALKPERRTALLRRLTLVSRAWSERINQDRPLLRDPRNERRSPDQYWFPEDFMPRTFTPRDDMTFPRDWVEKLKRRTKGIELTEEEKKIVKALESPISIDAEGKSLKEVLEYLREKSGVSIVVDPRALADLNITDAAPINTKFGKVSLRTVLKHLLDELDLTYVMEGQAIQITTRMRAKEMLTIRVYTVADLMPVVDILMPAVIGQEQMKKTLPSLVLKITETIEPDTWEVNGKCGFGTIKFDPVRFAFIVKQTPEMHYLLSLGRR